MGLRTVRKKGIGNRVARLMAVAVILAVVVVAGLISVYDANVAAQQKRAAVEGTAYVFASAVADHVATRDASAIRTVLRSLDRVPGVISATVHGADGKAIATLGQKALLTSDVIVTDPSFFDMMSKGIVPVSVDIIKGGAVQGTLVLTTDISDLRQDFFQTMMAVVAASLLAAAFAMLLLTPLLRKIVDPIQKLTRSVQDLRVSQNYAVTLPRASDDETGILVENFNGLLHDIRDRDQSLQQLAYFDTLTGLPNRAAFQRDLAERLAGLQQDGSQVAAILLDIDGFRALNNAFGLAAGDAILQHVGSILTEQSPPGALVARLGGDEFGILVPDRLDGEAAMATLAHIHATFYQPINVNGMELHLTLSAGATLAPVHAPTVSDALRFMDLAANAARKQGAGRSAFFRQEMDETLRKETELAQRLRSAIDNNELTLHFQPQQQLSSWQIVGFEALVRWNHPTLGTVSPALFIPIAERSGFVAAIGDWVLREACAQARTWLDETGRPYVVAVNVSPAQILQSGFVRRVEAALADARLPGELLCLELTESIFLGRSLGGVRSILDELSQLGVNLALDDFGTGFSSLAYLSQLPFNKLKIDRSFVTASQTSVKRTEILRSIVQMAHSLEMTVVAEGAETQAELQLLHDLGADQVQGFVVSKPVPAPQALALAEHLNSAAA
ncbi:MAG: EAL domain-containing protein [Proteobacteria bacterium]|nr:EAL domain-containing protein [Pseudomonadota bacterium]